MPGERGEAMKCVAWKIVATSTEKRTVWNEPLSLFQRLRARMAWNPSYKWDGAVTPTARRRDDVYLRHKVQAIAATTLKEHEKAPRRHSVFAQRGPWVQSSFLRAEQWSGSLTTSEAGRAGFWSGGAAPRSRDVLFVPSAIAR